MANLNDVHAVFAKLEAYVRAEPRLAQFVCVAAELREQARLVSEGAQHLPPLSATSPPNMPDRDLAIGIVQIISQLPQIEDTEPREIRRVLGTLLGNLVEGMTAAIYRTYPDAIPRERAV